MRQVFKRKHYPIAIILVCVRCAAYPLSLRHLEEMMAERGVFVEHSTIHRWAIRMLSVLAAVCRRRKCPWDWAGELTHPTPSCHFAPYGHYPVDPETLPPGISDRPMVTLGHAARGLAVGGVTLMVTADRELEA